MYFHQSNTKDRTKIYEYDLSRGLVDASRSLCGGMTVSMNISPDGQNILTPRKRFYRKEVEGVLTGLGCAGEVMYYTTGNGFYYGGKYVGSVDASRKHFVNFNKMILIFPDKKYYDTESGIFGSLSVSTGEITVMLRQSTNTSGLNVMESEDTDFSRLFGVGSGIYIEGGGLKVAAGIHIVKEIDGSALIFDEGEFDGELDESAGEIICTVSNRVPDGAALCVCGGRVWTCSGSRIYASAYADPFNWCAYDGGGTSSYTVDTGDFDEFTYCAEIGGYPVYFTKNKIYKIYGDEPMNFSLRCVASYGGIAQADVYSTAFLDDELFYLSDGRVMRFSGNEPEAVPGFPAKNIDFGIGGGLKDRYYVVTKDIDGGVRSLVYDRAAKVWSELDATGIDAFLRFGRNLYASSGNTLCIIDGDGDIPEGFSQDARVSSEAVFDDLEMPYARRYPIRIFADITVEGGGEVILYAMYDRDGAWQELARTDGYFSGVRIIELPLMGCSFWKLKVCAEGEFSLKDLSVQYNEE